ncbi:MAG: twin-arginine translocation signal domain-containing protein [Egibacteraceae bacterium]
MTPATELDEEVKAGDLPGLRRQATVRLFAEQRARVGLVCGGVVVAVVALAGVSQVMAGVPPSSLWEPVAGVAVRVGIAYPLGRRLVRTHLARYVTHGQTRRDFLRAAAVVGAAYALLLATVWTVGLAAESWAYQALDWAHLPLWSHLFHTPQQVWLVFVEYGLIMALWTAAGAAVAASKFHSPSRSWGFLAALALVALAESAVGTPLPGGVGFTVSPPLLAAVALCVAVIAAGGAVTWRVLRATPVPRSRS